MGDQDEMLQKYMDAKALSGGPRAAPPIEQVERGNAWGAARQPDNRQQNFRQQPRQHRGGGGGGNQWGGHDGENEVPMAVRNFIEDLSTSIVDKRVSALDDMYSKEYPRICEQLMRNKLGKSQKWPTLDEVLPFLNDDNNSRLLYKELYYRHIFARLDKQITGEDRVAAYENYQSIFDTLGSDLQNPTEKSLLKALPLTWMWDILDEFIYQYMQFRQFKAKAISKKAKSNIQPAAEGRTQTQIDLDYEIVKENPLLFEPAEVFYTVKRLINQTSIDVYLKWHKGEASDTPEGMLPDEPTRYLGYFAYIQQMRYHLLLGEYDVALKTVERLDFGLEDALYYRSPAAHITLSYFVSFSLFMQKRYSDCMSVISKCLYFVVKLQRFPPLASLYDGQQRCQERMMRLLVLCQVFAPDSYHAGVDEQIAQFVMDKYAEDIKILKTWGLDDSVGDVVEPGEQQTNRPFATKMIEWFNAVSVKYVTILAADAVENGNVNPMEGFNRQWERFWQAMDEQKTVPMIRNFLGMYTRISLAKLTKFCKYDSEETTLQKLQQVERQQQQLVMQETWNAAGKKVFVLLPGVPAKCSTLDFSYDATTKEISVQLLTKPKHYAQTYIKEIHHLDTIMAGIKEIETN